MTTSPLAIICLCTLIALAHSESGQSDQLDLISSPRIHRIVKRVIGGDDASIEQAPYVVQLVRHNRAICTGSIIGSSDTILTAGHCLSNGVDFVVYGTSRKYTASSHYLFKKASVARIHLHPQYHGGVSPNDIGIIKLNRSILPDSTAAAISLETDPGHCHSFVKLYGFGRSAFSYNPGLQTMESRIINSCRARSVNNNFILTQMRGKTICNGDSGGPLVAEVDGRQIGVVSGMSIDGCVPGDLNFFVKVSNHIDFIQQHFFRLNLQRARLTERISK